MAQININSELSFTMFIYSDQIKGRNVQYHQWTVIWEESVNVQASSSGDEDRMLLSWGDLLFPWWGEETKAGSSVSMMWIYSQVEGADIYSAERPGPEADKRIQRQGPITGWVSPTVEIIKQVLVI